MLFLDAPTNEQEGSADELVKYLDKLQSDVLAYGRVSKKRYTRDLAKKLVNTSRSFGFTQFWTFAEVNYKVDVQPNFKTEYVNIWTTNVTRSNTCDQMYKKVSSQQPPLF